MARTAAEIQIDIDLANAAIRRIITGGKKSASLADGQMTSEYENLSLGDLRELLAALNDELISVSNTRRGFYVS